MIELFKEKLPVSYVDLNKANVDLSTVICLFEKGVLRWCVLQEYIQSQLQNNPTIAPDVEAVFLKVLLTDEAYSSWRTLLDTCEAMKETITHQGKTNKKAFHFVLKFLMQNEFFKADLNPISEHEWWQFYGLLDSLLAIFEFAMDANELQMEHFILSELRFSSAEIVLSALVDLEFKDEFVRISQTEQSVIQRLLDKIKKIIFRN